MFRVLVASMLALTGGCRAEPSVRAPEAPAAPAPVTALDGAPLQPSVLPQAVRAQREDELAAARRAHEAGPTLETTIWLGRRTAYLGRYHEAIGIYTEGLSTYGEDPRLLRHRGHRFITTRQLERARDDLQRAASLIEGTPDVIEADGLPNAAGVPTSTLHTNVYYHLGLVHFLLGEFEAARDAYQRCMAAATTDDMRVATAHWLYMSHRRLGEDEAAQAVLAPLAGPLELHENLAYQRLLQRYRGELEPEPLIGPDAGDLDRATLGFGLGHLALVEGDTAAAAEAFADVLKTPQWAAFGYIAAEAEQLRLRPR